MGHGVVDMWSLLACVGVSTAGAMVFLGLVADDVELAAGCLEAMEAQSRKRYEKRVAERVSMEEA